MSEYQANLKQATVKYNFFSTDIEFSLATLTPGEVLPQILDWVCREGSWTLTLFKDNTI